MPNRIIKESICTSDNIDQLTDFQETFFYRLMVNCDDFGRFDARPKLLSSRLYPLKSISTEMVEETLIALQNADLITLYEVDGHQYLFVNKWDLHQQKRSDKSKYPDPADGSCVQLKSNDINCNQLKSDDIKSSRIRNRNRNTNNDNRESLSTSACEDDDVFHQIQSEHNRVLDAAEDAGFKMSNDVRAEFISLYADHGMEKILAGLKSCVEHGAPNLAYLKACLRGDSKKPPGKSVPAQQYSQRSYDGEQEAAMQAMIAGYA